MISLVSAAACAATRKARMDTFALSLTYMAARPCQVWVTNVLSYERSRQALTSHPHRIQVAPPCHLLLPSWQLLPAVAKCCQAAWLQRSLGNAKLVHIPFRTYNTGPGPALASWPTDAASAWQGGAVLHLLPVRGCDD
jgi:hypothetical protein